MEAAGTPQKFYRNIALDGFRGFGCLLVMLGHTHWQGRTVLPGAMVSMDLFFVLSGFLITGLLLAEHRKTGTISFTAFWKRRVIRLLPVFYVFYAIVCAAYYFTGFKPIVGDDALVAIASTGLYLTNWAAAAGYDTGVYWVTWSLALEEQFYFLWPMVFLFLLKRHDKKKVLWIMAAFLLAANAYKIGLYHYLVPKIGYLYALKRIFYALDTRADALAVGCLGAVFYNLYGDRIKFGMRWGYFAAIVVFGSMFLVRDVPVAYKVSQTSLFTEIMAHGGFTLFSLIFMIGIIHVIQCPQSIITRFFSTPILVRLGLISYSVYIWHTACFGGLDILLKPLNQSLGLWILKSLIRITTAIGVGYLSFRLIEIHSLRWLARKQLFSPVPVETTPAAVSGTSPRRRKLFARKKPGVAV